MYDTRGVDSDNIVFENDLITPLSEEKADSCEGKITNKECWSALKELQNGKTPGSDGFTPEFYKFFWKEIGNDVVASINYVFDKGELSICQKRGIITLLPKENKPNNILNNFHPISLLNTDYKIATKALAKRLEKNLPQIINADQTGYIKKRYVGENTA